MNQIVLVTGGAVGIGRAIAEAFAKQNAQVIIWYNSSATEAHELCALYPNITSMQVDITDTAQVTSGVNTIIERYHTIDTLINNAGVCSYSMLIDLDYVEISHILNTNLLGTITVCKEVARHMLYKQGNIINISSMWGLVGSSCEAVYSATKAGIIGLTKSLAKELCPNIRVNCIAPGAIATDMIQGFSSDELQEIIDSTPLARLGSPADVANVALFLASDMASFITGEVINVNGGIVI